MQYKYKFNSQINNNLTIINILKSIKQHKNNIIIINITNILNLIFYIFINIFFFFLDLPYLKKITGFIILSIKQLSVLNKKIPQSNALRYFRLNNK